MKWIVKNKLDGMQEMKLRGLESNGCWFAFWALLAVIMIQLAMGAVMKQLAGEWIVFMCLALYLCFTCMQAGIWDRRIPASPLANLVCSLIAGIAVWILFTFVMMHNGVRDNLTGAILSAGFIGLFTFGMCFVALSICSACYKSREKKLEEGPKEDLQ